MPKEYNFKKILQQLVKDFDGIDIFSEENALRLNKALNRLDEKFSIERETLLVAKTELKMMPVKNSFPIFQLFYTNPI